MTAISDISDIVNRLTGGSSGTPEHLPVWIDNRVGAAAATATVAGRWTSLWQYNKCPGGQGAAPGAVAAPTEATTGALGQTDPGGGRQKWLLGVDAFANQLGTLVLYDRLLHISSMDGTNTGAQNVGGTITRWVDTAAHAVGNQIWIEIYGQIGTTATTITAIYLDENGGSSTTPAVQIGGTGRREAQRLIPLPLADGDRGVTGVTSVTLLATTGTAGDFGVTVARPILIIPMMTNVTSIRGFVAGLPSIQEALTNACLAWAWFSGGTTAPQIFATPHFVEA